MSRTSTYIVIIFIGFGGAIGSIARYGVAQLFPNNSLPFGTILVNILGCFLLAFLSNHTLIKKKLPKYMILAIHTGVIGSFTTFSTFTVESLVLLTDHLLIGVAYMFGSIIFGLIACFIGYLLASRMDSSKETVE
ncbi:Putative fluoride ion transporter CrcB [Paraliobacillus sp. PM-2]|uniref:fluoride efflux transporter CrcB n=1 Tax=Paraliobacillus sp. PM-2 TaxID=1462524 RepID=UPI00061C3BEF|nr:fluoride efflux transporter CrcB [Paraliobacillus sp. PM-2]CQR46525.1 Putative fluoride ion transporter CrcB [Paraliobacillus sp. PM-2]